MYPEKNKNGAKGRYSLAYEVDNIYVGRANNEPNTKTVNS